MQKFILIGHPRTGSSLLKELISQNSDCLFFGELFHPIENERRSTHVIQEDDSLTYYNDHEEDAFEYLNRTIWRKENERFRAVGFKLFSERIDCPGTKRLFARIKEEYPDIKIIHLIRDNMLDIYVSRKRAELSGIWRMQAGSDRSAYEAGGKFAIDPNLLEQFFKQTSEMTGFFKTYSRTNDYIEISYDDLSKNPQLESSRVFDFLSLQNVDVNIPLQKQNKSENSSLVLNYDQLLSFFKNTKYAHYYGLAQPGQIIEKTRDKFCIGCIDYFHPGNDRNAKTTSNQVVILKPAQMLNFYQEYFKQKGVKNVLEFGIWQGGSPLALTELLGLNNFIGIDIKGYMPVLDEIIKSNNLQDKIRLYYETSQSDSSKVQQIIIDNFSECALDLIIDDASHHYNHSLKSFEISFPYLRPGGFYVIEDWGWSHWPGFGDYSSELSDQKSMSNLVFQLTMACASSASIIKSVNIYPAMAIVEKSASATGMEHKTFNLKDIIRIHGREFVCL